MQRRTGGYLLLETMLGLALIGLLLAVVTQQVIQQRRAAKGFAQQRAAERLAERTAGDLLLGREVKAGAESAGRIEQQRLDTPAPEGFTWVRVQADVEAGQAFVFSLVPAAGDGPGKGGPP